MTAQTLAGNRRRFNVDEYYAMADAGIIAANEKVELLDGELFVKYRGTRRRFTVDEYYALAKAGILSLEERVELLDGEIIAMAPMHSQHAACIRLFEEYCTRLSASERRNAVKCRCG